MSDTTLIISAKWLVPVDDDNTVLTNHSIVIENGIIVDICDTENALKKFPDAKNTERSTHLLIPGLINAHTHAAMSLFRGLADDIPLMDWLNNHIWPAEAKWVSEEFMADGVELAIAEMLLSGTTCFNDMYFFPNIVARIAQDIGIRSCIGLIVIDSPTIWAKNVDEYLQKGLEVHDEARSLSLISTAFAPHAPYTVGNEALEQIQLYADELNTPIHMHIHETAFEVESYEQQFGLRPLARLNELGLLTPRMLAVHMTQLNEQEIELAANQGIHIVHCPESNLKLNSGYCPVQNLQQQGINISLGTDSASSNNDLDMLGEMRTAALLAKTVANDAQALSAHDALKMATINAARALNMDNEIGSLEIGKAADIVAIDLNRPSTQPVYDPVSQLVYSASREQVSDVWVHGLQTVKNRQLTTLDQQHIIDKASYWAEKIASNRL